MKDMNPVEILERALRDASFMDDDWQARHTLVGAAAKALTALRGPEPDWSEAPEDATHHAIDNNGVGRWWRVEPEPCGYAWDAPGFGRWVSSGMFDVPLGADWRLTLRKRPESGG